MYVQVYFDKALWQCLLYKAERAQADTVRVWSAKAASAFSLPGLWAVVGQPAMAAVAIIGYQQRQHTDLHSCLHPVHRVLSLFA